MTDPSKHSGSNSVSDLVEAVRNPPVNGSEGAAWQLAELVRETARRLSPAYGRGSQLLRDVVEEAPGLVFEKLGHFDSGREFGPWCRTVLLNEYRSRCRRRRRDPLSGEPFEESAGVGAGDEWQRHLEEWLDVTTEFSTADQTTVAVWPLQNRLILLSMSRLWRKVGEANWSAWLCEGCISPPFPDDGWESESLRVQCEILGEMFNMRPDTVKHFWHRHRSWVRRLEFVQELTP